MLLYYFFCSSLSIYVHNPCSFLSYHIPTVSFPVSRPSEDEGRRGPMEAAGRAVDRRAAEATADEGRQESKPTKDREQVMGSLIHFLM